MVTRPDFVPAPLSQANNNPPYPVTPTSEEPPTKPSPAAPSPAPAATSTTAAQTEPQSSPNRANTTHGSDSEWDSSGDEGEGPVAGRPLTPDGVTIPKASHAHPDSRDVPAALRPGPPGGVLAMSVEEKRAKGVADGGHIAHSETEPDPNHLRSNNPYLRMQSNDFQAPSDSVPSLAFSEQTSLPAGPPAPIPARVNVPPQNNSPVELMGDLTATDALQNASIAERRPSYPGHPPIPLSTETFPAPHYAPPSTYPDSRQDSLGTHQSTVSTLPWSGPGNHSFESTTPGPRDVSPLPVEHTSADTGKFESGNTYAMQDDFANLSVNPEGSSSEVPPALPPRTLQDTQEGMPPPQPPRPDFNGSRKFAETTSGPANTGRAEHYQIKSISWVDQAGVTRKSPILTQNANGPCPLLALVNALVLTTPVGSSTALVDNLRTREQVSLGLLLDAVFDELTSGRRRSATQELPDVTKLYSFLLNLHSGMNVNPQFVQSTASLMGGFEETHEMRLYSTFNVPLIHGWTPTRDSPEYSAFERAARTYEDAQNLLFREEELEEKLSSSGLTPSEQELFQDVVTIKDFLSSWSTQLTVNGLAVMASGLRPGDVCILFRNDHFSTLYKHPTTGQLFTLVTDAGYAGHKDIVWESLVDVSGQRNELCAGNFKPAEPLTNTGAAARTGQQQGPRPVRSLLDDDDDATGPSSEWTTVRGRESRRQETVGSRLQPGRPGMAESEEPLSPAEQEDHDLALALQLQEEEEEHQRQRQREEQLSRDYLSQDSHAQVRPPTIPPRRSAAQQRANNAVRPGNSDAPPPTYEQAAQRQPYHPPRHHPASPHAPLPYSGDGQHGVGPGQASAPQISSSPGRGRRYSGRPTLHTAPNNSGWGRGQPIPPAGQGGPSGQNMGDRERCNVM